MFPTYQHELYGQTRQTISTIEHMLNSQLRRTRKMALVITHGKVFLQ
jgi:hypothetical protein